MASTGTPGLLGMVREEAERKDRLYTREEWVVIAVLGAVYFGVQFGLIPAWTVVPM